MATFVVGFEEETDIDYWRSLTHPLHDDPDQMTVEKRKVIETDAAKWGYKHQLLETARVQVIMQLRPKAILRVLFGKDRHVRHGMRWYTRMGRLARGARGIDGQAQARGDSNRSAAPRHAAQGIDLSTGNSAEARPLRRGRAIAPRLGQSWVSDCFGTGSLAAALISLGNSGREEGEGMGRPSTKSSHSAFSFHLISSLFELVSPMPMPMLVLRGAGLAATSGKSVPGPWQRAEPLPRRLFSLRRVRAGSIDVQETARVAAPIRDGGSWRAAQCLARTVGTPAQRCALEAGTPPPESPSGAMREVAAAMAQTLETANAVVKKAQELALPQFERRRTGLRRTTDRLVDEFLAD